MKGKKGIAASGITAFFILILAISQVMSSQTSLTISNSVTIDTRGILTIGLPSANVYVVRDDSAGNYATINGSDTTQVLETNTNPVTAINDAITKWVPINGKLVTNGTMADWSGTVTPSHGNFTWEAWKTKVTQKGTGSGYFYGVNIANINYVTVDNFTYIGTNSTAWFEMGFRCFDANYIDIENCTVTQCSYIGIGFVSGAGGNPSTECMYDTVRLCNASYNWGAYQISFTNVGSSTIANNTCNCGGYGSCIGDFDIQSDILEGKNIIANNTCLQWGGSVLWHGIYWGGDNGTELYGNTVYTSSTGGGVAMQDKGTGCYCHNNNITISGITDWAYGVTSQGLGGPHDTVIANDTITYISIGGSVAGYGIGLEQGCYNCTIANCTFIGPWEPDIFLDSEVVGNPIYNDSIYNNVLNGGTAGIGVGYLLDSVGSLSQINVHNNTLENISGQNLARTFSISSNASGVVVHDNVFINCSASSLPWFYDVGSGTLIYNNTGLTGYKMLNVTAAGDGSTSPSGLGWQYVSGTSVSVTWTPSTGYARQNFSIDGTNQSTTVSPVSLHMTTDHVAIAYFVASP